MKDFFPILHNSLWGGPWNNFESTSTNCFAQQVILVSGVTQLQNTTMCSRSGLFDQRHMFVYHDKINVACDFFLLHINLSPLRKPLYLLVIFLSPDAFSWLLSCPVFSYVIGYSPLESLKHVFLGLCQNVKNYKPVLLRPVIFQVDPVSYKLHRPPYSFGAENMFYRKSIWIYMIST